MNTLLSSLGVAAMVFAAIVVPIGALVVGFHILDRWHQRKAWRDADRRAREIMARERLRQEYPRKW